MAVNKKYRYPLEKAMILLFPIITLSMFVAAIAGLFIGSETVFPEIIKFAQQLH